MVAGGCERRVEFGGHRYDDDVLEAVALDPQVHMHEALAQLDGTVSRLRLLADHPEPAAQKSLALRVERGMDALRHQPECVVEIGVRHDGPPCTHLSPSLELHPHGTPGFNKDALHGSARTYGAALVLGHATCQGGNHLA
eukprot:scaffold172478_cov24-Tisochrysis_lutea.AAC.1